MKDDDYKKYYETDEANLDSKSDSRVILFLIVQPVIALTYWTSFE